MSVPYAADLAGRDPIEAIYDAAARMQALTAAWTPAQFERSHAPGKWTARLVLIHLAQSEIAFGARARMAASTTDHAAPSFDQDRWMAQENALSGRDAADAYVVLARMNAGFFAGLSPSARQTAFSHPEYGALTVDWLIHQTAGHQIHHLEQLLALGRKP